MTTHWAVHIKLLGMALLWGASWPWGRLVAQNMPPLTGAASRFVLATLALGCWLVYAKGWQTVKALQRQQWLGLTVAAAAGVFGYACFFMWGLQYIPASKGAVVITLNPALTLLLAAWLFKERLNGWVLLGMLMAVGGALTVVTHGQFAAFFAEGVGLGDVLILGCVVCWVAYTLIGRVVLRGIDSLTATMVTAAIGALMLLTASVWYEGAAAWHMMWHAPSVAWWSLLALAFGATAMAYAWYFDGVKVLGAGNAAAYIALVPVFGVAISVIWLGEALSASLIWGGLVAVVGMLLMHFGKQKR